MKKKLLIILLSLFLLTGCFDKSETFFNGISSNLEKYFTKIPDNDPFKSKYLVLVNKNNIMDFTYIDNIELVDVLDKDGDTVKLEKKTYEEFQNLQKTLEEKNIIIGINAAYRTLEEQQFLVDHYTNLKGVDYVNKYISPAGSSEHHTGLAIDIIPMVNGNWGATGEDTIILDDYYVTIHELLSEYGFILRYPKGKENITGYAYEKWHIRYVGKEHAIEIYNNNLTLEEYINNHKTLTNP